MNNKGVRALSRMQLQGKWLMLALINVLPYLVLFAIFWFLNEYLWVLLAIPVTFAIKQICFDVACQTEKIDFNVVKFNPKMILGVYVYRIFMRLIDRVYFLLKVVGLASIFGGGIFAFVGTFLAVHKQMILGMIIPKKLGLAGLGLGIGFLQGGIIFKLMVFEIIFAVIYLGVVYLKTMFFFTDYILMRDNKDLSIINAMKEARLVMKGEEIKFIKLELSFAGWYILSLLSFGIGFIFLNPYIAVANANFYMEVLKKKARLTKKLRLIDGDVSVLNNRYDSESPKYNPNIRTGEVVKSEFKKKEFIPEDMIMIEDDEMKYYEEWIEIKRAEEEKRREEEALRQEQERREFEEWKKFKAEKDKEASKDEQQRD